MAVERYNYERLAVKNEGFDASRFIDLTKITTRLAYDPQKQPTNNIRALLYSFYPEDKASAGHHAFALFSLLHEQCKAQGMSDGFNDLSQKLDSQCGTIDLANGKLRFLDKGGNLMGEFVLSSAQLSEQSQRVAPAPLQAPSPEAARKLAEELAQAAEKRKRKADEIAERTKEALKEALPDFQPGSLKRPKLEVHTFRFPPSYFKNTGKAPLLVDVKSVGETVCAGWATEYLRYTLGNKAIQQYQLENKAAWEVKQTLTATNAVKTDFSLGNFLQIHRDKIALTVRVRYPNGKSKTLVGEAAKQSPYYQLNFRKFIRAASPEKFPPRLITLYYHGTRRNKDIIAANRERGVDSRNSHIVVNLGEGRKALQVAAFTSAEKPKSVADIVWINFPNANRRYDWMFLESTKTNLSKVYLNGEQLSYRVASFIGKTVQRQLYSQQICSSGRM